MSPMVILGILLAISVAGNVWQYHEHTVDSIRLGTTKQLADDTKAAAQACTQGVLDLDKAGKARQRRLEDALAAVAPKVAQEQQAAIAALQARPDDPKDLCGSLERWWKARIAEEKKK